MLKQYSELLYLHLIKQSHEFYFSSILQVPSDLVFVLLCYEH